MCKETAGKVVIAKSKKAENMRYCKKNKLSVILVAFLLIGSVVVSGTGCQQALFSMVYLWKGRDVEPEYNVLKKGPVKVVVICRSVAMDQFENETVPRDLTRQVSKLLKKNVKNKKLEVVDYRKVEKWLDDCSQNYEDFDEVGVVFKADYVVGIELQGFRVQESPGTMQCKAHWVVKTYDMKNDEWIGEKRMSIVNPPSMPIAMQDNRSLPTFRIKCVDIIAKQIAALYHPHDPNKIYDIIDADSLSLH